MSTKSQPWTLHSLLFLGMLKLALSDSLSEEGLALLAMKAGFMDPLNHLQDWKLNGTATPCLWTGIACNNVSSVVGLYLGYMNLTGTLSSDIGRLRSLVNVSLEGNNFTGLLPEEVTSQLVKVVYLNVSNNVFSGVFPANNISLLQSLQVLSI